MTILQPMRSIDNASQSTPINAAAMATSQSGMNGAL